MAVAPARRLRLRLAIPADEVLRLYQGEARQVLASSEDGRSVRFPASALRRHVTRAGVYGRFELRFDAGHHLLELRRLGD